MGDVENGSPAAPASRDGLWPCLGRRGVFTSLVIYCPAAWGVLEAGQFFIGYFGLGPAALRMLVVTVIAGLPFTVALSWFHGLPGAQAVSRREVTVLSAIVVAWAVVLSWPAFFPDRPTAAAVVTPAPPAHPGSRRVAVLYFANLGADPSLDWLATGLVDSILADLAGLKGIELLSRSAVAPYRGPRSIDPSSITTELSCDLMVSGSFRAHGARIRVSCRLLEVSSRVTTGAFTVDGETGDPFTLQDAVAARLRSLLVGSGSADAPPGGAPRGASHVRFGDGRPSVAYYRSYCEALQALDQHLYDQAAERFSRALEGGMTYAPSLDELLALDHQVRTIDDRGRITSQGLVSEKNELTAPMRTLVVRGTSRLLEIRSTTGRSLGFRVEGPDGGGNYDHIVGLDEPIPPGGQRLYWEKLSEREAAIALGRTWWVSAPPTVSYLGPPRRASDTLVLPRGAEPLFAWPDPRRIFYQDGLWRLSWARKLGEDVFFDSKVLYATDAASIGAADELDRFVPDRIYGPAARALETAPLPVAEKELPVLLLTRARIALELCQPEKAGRILGRCLELPLPASLRVAVHHYLGQAFVAQKQEREASLHFRKAAEQVASLAADSAALVWPRSGAIDLETRVATWRESGGVLAALRLADAYLAIGAIPDARRLSEKALALEPSAPWVHQLAARIDLARGLFLEASAHALEAVRIPPVEAWACLADALLIAHEHGPFVEASVKFHGSYPRLALNRARRDVKACAEALDREGMIKLTNAYCQPGRKLGWILNRLVYDLAVQSEARSGADRARILSQASLVAGVNSVQNPDSIEFKDTLAEMTFLSGRDDEAARLFGEILARDPQWNRARYFQARIARRAGTKTQARRLLEGLLPRLTDPNDAELRRQVKAELVSIDGSEATSGTPAPSRR
ncbi:MAG: hypothetical protein HY815_29440 [Candidatus Riflebacteria bacterium]|nr:hypothetical protein [Candidatus Riflebacteria bacterium]